MEQEMLQKLFSGKRVLIVLSPEAPGSALTQISQQLEQLHASIEDSSIRYIILKPEFGYIQDVIELPDNGTD